MIEDCDIKWQDRLTMALLAVVVLAAAAAMIGMAGKKEGIITDIETFDVDDLIIIDSEPLPSSEFDYKELPEIEAEAEVLPEILPPLFDEPLPPLQGEV